MTNYLYMKLIILFFTLQFFTSCTSNKIELLQNENQQLKIQIKEQQLKLRALNNSFVIPYDSIDHYMQAAVFGKNNIKKNEKSEFTTMLVWSKFPKGIKYTWQITDGKGEQKNTNSTEIIKHVMYSYSETGKKDIVGQYILELPNKNKTVFTWLKPTFIQE